MKNILIINSLKKIDQSLFGLLGDLSGNNVLFGWFKEKIFLEKFKSIGRAKKIFFGPSGESLVGFLSLIFLVPILWIGYFFNLYFFTRKRKIKKIICIGFREKIIFTPIAKILKLAVVWLYLPGGGEQKGKIYSAFLKLFSGSVEIAVFTMPDAVHLAEIGFKKEKINNVSLGVNLSVSEHQDNIFYNLAKADKPYSFYKNFTVGAVVSASDRRRLELLLQATKSCLNFIPNFRLVVIGAIPENGNLNWLVKKMGIENRVWFVGEQKNSLQWFADFDLYVVLQKNPGLGDLETAMLAASRGVPIAAFREKNMSDIIIEGETGFWIEKDSAEALGQRIVEIEADQLFCRKIGKNCQAMVREHFDREKQIKRLRAILDS